MQNLELIKFVNGCIELEVNVSPEENTVWLTNEQMAMLFGRNRTVIGRHLRNIFKEGELDEKSVRAKFAHTASDGKTYTFDFYNLDAIISIGYRVKSENGIIFRRWASEILKDYMLKGYAANERKLEALNKTIELQSKIIATAYEIDSNDVKKVVDSYIDALTLLDNYDHQCVPEIKRDERHVPLTTDDIRTIVENMEYYGKSDVFGVEKEKGKVDGILGAVYQNVFGQEVYPSIKEKAAHLLYFMVKDHPFADGCKRIAAASFLTFLAKNKALNPRLSSQVLVAVTLLTAESNPKDFKSIIKVIANII
ncbi:MAG: virulence RhuM family protein [Bacilli bacterium]|nr:virulence RhuM family protein [Bacilli bacterium]